MRTLRPAVFLDKDGTLVEDVPYNVDLARVTLCDGTLEGLRLLKEYGYALVVVSNQSGLALGRFDDDAFEQLRAYLMHLLECEGTPLDGFYHCPHHPDGTVERYAKQCTCRKPMSGMLLQAASDLGISLADSWMVGDILHDIEAGHRAGCRTVLIDNGNETEWMLSPLRIPDHACRNLHEAAQAILAHDLARREACL